MVDGEHSERAKFRLIDDITPVESTPPAPASEEPFPKVYAPPRETNPAAAKTGANEKVTYVLGFVNIQGPVQWSAGMTLPEAIEKAGGQDGCEDCEGCTERHGTHPSFTRPPRVTRGGKIIKWDGQDETWKTFQLEPGDIVEVLHYYF